MTVSYLPLDPPVTAGAHYFTLSELRDEQDLPPTYPDSAITPNRDLAEQVLETECGSAFIPRRRVEQLVAGASGMHRLSAPLVRAIETIIVDGFGIDVTTVTLDGNYLGDLTWTTSGSVTYTHGYDSPPLRIRRAAMIATRIWTTRGPVDDRATQIAADGATVNLATPGVLGSITGIPEVDATIHAYWRPGALY